MLQKITKINREGWDFSHPFFHSVCMKCVAVICARGLGDALLSMILSHNLSLSNVQVTTFSSVLYELREWFPSQTLLPYPSSATLEKTFSIFDTVIAADHNPLTPQYDFKSRLIFLKESQFDRTVSMADNLQDICRTRLSLPYCEKNNGLIIPTGLSWRLHPQRVVIHPTSTNIKKNWPAEKFIQLGHKLEKRGFTPFFCVSPAERNIWLKKVPAEQLPLFPTLHELASFVFESGSMIGNDSGTGHLASALHIPTLSLFARESYSRLWRPGWGKGSVVTPPNFLPGARLKQKYWKHLLSVRKVQQAFFKMGAER